MEDNGKHTVRLARWVHWSLLLGLAASSLALIAGLTLALVRSEPRPEGPPPAALDVLTSAAQGSGVALLLVGLVLLMLTPVARVVVLALGWSLDRQWPLALIALAVLVLLSFSVFLGAG